MTDDLVKRLRLCGDRASFVPSLHHAAADRIDALEAKLSTVLSREAKTHKRHDAKVDVLEAEAARLTAERDGAEAELVGAFEAAAEAVEELSKSPGTTWGQVKGYIRAMGDIGDRRAYQSLHTEAAEAKLVQGVRVKPLVWVRTPDGYPWDWQARCELTADYYYASTDAKKGEHEAARTVRILAAIEAVPIVPVPASQIANETLDRVSKAIGLITTDDAGGSWPSDRAGVWLLAFETVQKTIRAMKGTTK